ncbi:MAG: type VI secretion system lipoprotein TssJ [Methylococcaceae bacterium]|nr:type VI secretion system lipoprotein TssJ [Methylococcaceae bacterium]
MKPLLVLASLVILLGACSVFRLTPPSVSLPTVPTPSVSLPSAPTVSIPSVPRVSVPSVPTVSMPQVQVGMPSVPGQPPPISASPISPVQLPTKVELQIEAGSDINPGSQGAAAPLVIRIYELRGLSAFNSADFFALYDKDQAALGGDLVQKRELLIRPGEKQTLLLDPAEGVGFIGAIAAFRQLDASQWRVSASIPVHRASVFALQVNGTNMSLMTPTAPKSTGSPAPVRTAPVPVRPWK